MPKFQLPVTQEEYEAGGSKFITFPKPIEHCAVGDSQYRDIEIGMLDWDTPGASMKLPVTVTEDGPDKGKEEKISFGVSKEAVWKGKDIYRAITGDDMPFDKGTDGAKHPVPDSDDLFGKPAVGMWVIQEGKKGGVGETVKYPKLVSILPAGEKPTTESLL